MSEPQQWLLTPTVIKPQVWLPIRAGDSQIRSSSRVPTLTSEYASSLFVSRALLLNSGKEADSTRQAHKHSCTTMRPSSSLLMQRRTVMTRLQRLSPLSQARRESTSTGASSASSTSANEPPKQNIYKQFGRPFFKVFLGSMFTYQVLYWGWEKMRLDEIKSQKLTEIQALEKQVEEYRLSKGADGVTVGES